MNENNPIKKNLNKLFDELSGGLKQKFLADLEQDLAFQDSLKKFTAAQGEWLRNALWKAHESGIRNGMALVVTNKDAIFTAG